MLTPLEAPVAELVDAADSKSVSSEWEFDSPRGHHRTGDPDFAPKGDDWLARQILWVPHFQR